MEARGGGALARGVGVLTAVSGGEKGTTMLAELAAGGGGGAGALALAAAEGPGPAATFNQCARRKMVPPAAKTTTARTSTSHDPRRLAPPSEGGLGA